MSSSSALLAAPGASRLSSSTDCVSVMLYCGPLFYHYFNNIFSWVIYSLFGSVNNSTQPNIWSQVELRVLVLNEFTCTLPIWFSTQSIEELSVYMD